MDDETVVLIRHARLFAAALAATRGPAIGHGRGAEFHLGHFEQSAGDDVGHVGDFASHNVVGKVATDQLHEEIGQTFRHLGHFLDAGRAAQIGDHMRLRGGEEPRQVGLGDHPAELAILDYRQVTNAVVDHHMHHVRPQSRRVQRHGVAGHDGVDGEVRI